MSIFDPFIFVGHTVGDAFHKPSASVHQKRLERAVQANNGLAVYRLAKKLIGKRGRGSLHGRFDGYISQGAAAFCAGTGRNYALKGLLAAGVYPDGLYEAVKNQQTKTEATILAAKADVNERGDNLETPLHAAAANRDIGAVRRLLKAGANPYIKDMDGNNPLDHVKNRFSLQTKEDVYAEVKAALEEAMELRQIEAEMDPGRQPKALLSRNTMQAQTRLRELMEETGTSPTFAAAADKPAPPAQADPNNRRLYGGEINIADRMKDPAYAAAVRQHGEKADSAPSAPNKRKPT